MADTKTKSSSTLLLDKLERKRVLLVTAHFDDEVLFAGGLLTVLKTPPDILCVHKIYEKRDNPELFEQGFRAVVKSLNCNAFFGGFVPTKAKFMEGRATEYCFKCALIARYLAKYNRYDVIITHNAIGEYGHIDHVIVHYACKIAFKKHEMYNFGYPLKTANLTVEYNVARKKRLVDCYLPTWNPMGYPFCYEPETYIKMGAQI
jgi:hypothetical protein